MGKERSRVEVGEGDGVGGEREKSPCFSVLVLSKGLGNKPRVCRGLECHADLSVYSVLLSASSVSGHFLTSPTVFALKCIWQKTKKIPIRDLAKDSG